MDRIQKALEGITKSMRGLEIGPSYNPVAPKHAGWNVQALDHASQQELREKYKNHPVNAKNIEAVDFVCADNDFLAAIPAEFHGGYDYIIASHMIEHTTDLMAFLQQMETLLTPEGVLSLIVPDKLYCFDFFRPLSTTADVLYAHFQKRRTHSIKTAFEHIAYICYYRAQIIWGEQANAPAQFKLYHGLHEAIEAFDRLSDDPDGAYRDFHNWKFTPASFRLIMLELQLLEKTGFSTLRHYPSMNGEFFLHLTRKKAELPAADSEEAQALRLALLCEIQREIAAVIVPSAAPAALSPLPAPPALPRPLWVKAAKRVTPQTWHPALGRIYRKLRSVA